MDLNNSEDCAAKFRSNSKLGLVLFLGIVVANLLRKETSKSEGKIIVNTATESEI